jgi:hypothetical protein
LSRAQLDLTIQERKKETDYLAGLCGLHIFVLIIQLRNAVEQTKTHSPVNKSISQPKITAAAPVVNKSISSNCRYTKGLLKLFKLLSFFLERY